MKYYLYKENTLVAIGTCLGDHEPHVPDGFSIGYGDPPDFLKRVQNVERVISYKEYRREAYPPITDFVDAWVKQDEVALEEYRKKCLDVKLKYPKPVQ